MPSAEAEKGMADGTRSVPATLARRVGKPKPISIVTCSPAPLVIPPGPLSAAYKV